MMMMIVIIMMMMKGLLVFYRNSQFTLNRDIHRRILNTANSAMAYFSTVVRGKGSRIESVNFRRKLQEYEKTYNLHFVFCRYI
jgi:hypothetical protein